MNRFFELFEFAGPAVRGSQTPLQNRPDVTSGLKTSEAPFGKPSLASPAVKINELDYYEILKTYGKDKFSSQTGYFQRY